jgi:hypothetical protein
MSSIRAVFTAGLDAITVHGLHQWDYGRSLKISHPDLPAGLEVHFATAGSKEAIVHTVAGIVGEATVAIPNILLEQARPITAWVYRIGETLGKTLLTVTMPIMARPRPAASPSVPEEISDKYTEALGAMNAQVESLKGGNVVVALALNAQGADDAKFADRAEVADRAVKDGNGNVINDTYKPKALATFQPTLYLPAAAAGDVYQFKVTIDGLDCYATLARETGKTAQASLGWIKGTEEKHYILRVTDSAATVWSLTPGADMAMERTDLTVYFRQI